MTTKLGRQAAAVLRRAANILARRGWVQGALVDRSIINGRVRGFCAIGAIHVAEGKTPRWLGDHLGLGWAEMSEPSRLAAATAAQAAGREQHGRASIRDLAGSLMSWNDETGRTKEQVVSVFREAADALME
jgi:hypothetical protein